jgi:hypothetical protein
MSGQYHNMSSRSSGSGSHGASSALLSDRPQREHQIQIPPRRSVQVPPGRRSLSALDDKRAREFREGVYAITHEARQQNQQHQQPYYTSSGRSSGDSPRAEKPLTIDHGKPTILV